MWPRLLLRPASDDSPQLMRHRRRRWDDYSPTRSHALHAGPSGPRPGLRYAASRLPEHRAPERSAAALAVGPPRRNKTCRAAQSPRLDRPFAWRAVRSHPWLECWVRSQRQVRAMKDLGRHNFLPSHPVPIAHLARAIVLERSCATAPRIAPAARTAGLRSNDLL